MYIVSDAIIMKLLYFYKNFDQMGKNKYAILKQVIDFYEEYEQNEKHLDLLSFARWITTKLDEEPDLNRKVVSEKNAVAFPDEVPVTKFEYKSSEFYICPQHIPVLIHDPQKLVGLIPDADKLNAG